MLCTKDFVDFARRNKMNKLLVIIISIFNSKKSDLSLTYFLKLNIPLWLFKKPENKPLFFFLNYYYNFEKMHFWNKVYNPFPLAVLIDIFFYLWKLGVKSFKQRIPTEIIGNPEFYYRYFETEKWNLLFLSSI